MEDEAVAEIDAGAESSDGSDAGMVEGEAVVGNWSEEDESTGVVDGRPSGAVIPKVSPAPSQSELVSKGV